MVVTEVVTGSLTNEVQRVTLRGEGSMTIGTFRLEVKGTLADDKPRDKFAVDHDGMYWTSQLSANSTGEEVRTG